MNQPARRALLVATDDYTAPSLSRLRSPAQDVGELARVLADQAIGAFDVQCVINQPAHKVNEAVEDLFTGGHPDDVLLLYFSCHGVKDDAGRLYFATPNTRLDRLGSSAVASSFVADQLTASRSRKIILILDCCYSGAFTRGLLHRGDDGAAIGERLGGSGRAILCSSMALEYAFELDEAHVATDLAVTGAGRATANRPSIFTSAIVEGLATGEADHDEDGRICVDDLYEYARAKVLATTPNQTPVKFLDVNGELVVARSIKRRKPPSLPAEVRAAATSPLPTARHAAVDVLAHLATTADPTADLAYELLRTMQDDDSRSVAAHARRAIDDTGRTPAGGHRAPDNPAAPRLDYQPPFQPPADANRWSGPVAPPQPQPQPQPQLQDETGAAAAIYLMPFFTSLVLMAVKNRWTRFHAVQCALVDAFTIVFLIVEAIPDAIYTSARYGSSPVPEGDVGAIVLALSMLVVPCLLRAICVTQVLRGHRGSLYLLGRIARRIAYGRLSRA